MFMNLHTLPPGQSMFTLYIRPKGAPIEETEEFDAVASNSPLGYRHLAAVVIEKARTAVMRDYGPEVEVVGVVDQSAGDILFDCRTEGHVPLPLTLPTRVTEAFERPYDALLDLVDDGGLEYRDWLLEVQS